MLFLGLAVWVLLGIWGLYSLICIAFPLKPFKVRSSAAKSFAGTLIAWVGVLIVLGTVDFAPSPSTEVASVTTMGWPSMISLPREVRSTFASRPT